MPKTRVVLGDCTDVVAGSLKHEKFQLVFADPPFNIDHGYIDYNDNLDAQQYVTQLRDWVDTAVTATAENGITALYGPDNLCEVYLDQMRSVHSDFRRIAWVNNCFNFGVCNRHNYINMRTHLLLYSRAEKPTWNPDDIKVESARVRYRDKRVTQTSRGGTRVPGTVWGFEPDEPWDVPIEPFVPEKHMGRIQGNNKERWPAHPNQLPLKFYNRLVRAHTNPGDNVLDMFTGTGGLPLVCRVLDRNCVGVDIGRETAESAVKRINAQVELAKERCGVEASTKSKVQLTQLSLPGCDPISMEAV